MNDDGQKRAGGAIIDGQKKYCRNVISRNYGSLNCTRTMKSRVFLSAVASSTKRRFFLSVQIMPSRVLFERRTGPQLVKKSSLFMEPEGSLPHLQEPATCPCPEPDQSSLCLSIPVFEDPLKKIITPSAHRSMKWFLSLGFPY